jgi:hypothetical protein
MLPSVTFANVIAPITVDVHHEDQLTFIEALLTLS